ncbi:hypothetical protein B0H34DRAFT_770556 [Crassisporium funariophilum]|nr:hypothetical protein B0H34DRAFT_770556 [Crassisporium funariophilum]
MFPKLFFLSALASSVLLASATPQLSPRGLSLNPPTSVLTTHANDASSAHRATREVELTNAQRLAEGLPLKPPRRRGTGTQVARSAPSAVPSTFAGYIRATDQATGLSIGFVRTIMNRFGEYGLTNDPNARLEVTFTIASGSTTPIDITATNGLSAYPLLGGIVGFSSATPNINPGSGNYAYIGGSGATPPGSPAVFVGNSYTDATSMEEGSESAIWTFDPMTGGITAQWINTDLGKPITYIGYITDVLIFTGDKAAFGQSFGPTVFVDLSFVPI